MIVPTKNSACTIKACLESIRNQAESFIEVLVVDNASTDGTREAAAQFADKVLSWGPERSAQRNHGAQSASGDYLLFIDSDMVLEPEIITECLRMTAATGAVAVIIPEVTIGEGFWVKCRAIERSCYQGDNRIEAARFFPRKAFLSAGGYDELLVGGEDWDLSSRIARGAHLPRTTAKILHNERRLHLRNHLAKKAYYASSYWYFWRKHGRASFSLANTIARPAFLRNWRRLVRHPVLAAGIVVLKSLELGATVYGIAFSHGSRGDAVERYRL